MSTTAVPLHPVSRDVLPKLWIGVALLLAAALVFAWLGTGRANAIYGSSEDFLAWNAHRPGVETTESGLQYKVLEPGDGQGGPAASDMVLVNYEGRLPTGEVFDSGEQAPLNLARVIPGWTEGLQMMSRGARYRFWVPPALGYGETPPPDSPITEDSVMEFDVELVDFISQADLMQQMQMQGQMMPPGAPGAPGGPPAGGE